MSEKQACTAARYAEVIRAAGGFDNLTVLSSITDLGDDGTVWVHILTEWGTKDGRFVAEHEFRDGEYAYRIPKE